MSNEAIEQVQLLPEIDAERCVHTQVVDASCRACITSCPRSAWVFDDGSLGLNTSACDACAICVSACPQAAIDLPRPAPAVSLNDHALALIACEQAVASGGKGVIPCLNAIGLDELAGLYVEGVRRLAICRADCDACDRGRHLPFDVAMADLRRMLDGRGLLTMTTASIAAVDWPQLCDRELQPNRRNLFAVFRSASPMSPRLTGDRLAAARALPAGGMPGTGPVPHSPCIDIATCEACDACARICPQNAIRLDLDSSAKPVYLIEAGRCTGCRMCIDVCAAGAISLTNWRQENRVTIVLDEAQCTSCGNPYRMPEGRPNDQTLCRICAKTSHASNLFQVMK